ncbi:MAG: hypothetical protein JRI46_09010 [Deltaproteobacteria bacterium]|nr:hypothetical protein [Deltaproteobacteria bacterium]
MSKGIWRKRGVEKGRFFRTKVLMPTRLRLFDLVKGKRLTSWVEGNTKELAEDGFVIEVDRVMVDGFHILTDAMKEGRGLDLEWELPTEGDTLRGKGKVLWFRQASNGPSHPFEAGVLLMEMGKEERKRWLEFTKGLPG